jgi:hypothetical protein
MRGGKERVMDVGLWLVLWGSERDFSSYGGFSDLFVEQASFGGNKGFFFW